MSYYNTTSEEGQLLKLYREKALTQDEILYNFFSKYKHQSFTPYEIQKKVFNGFAPITSVGRSLNTLTNQNKIKMTGEKRKGQFNRDVNCWKWN